MTMLLTKALPGQGAAYRQRPRTWSTSDPNLHSCYGSDLAPKRVSGYPDTMMKVHINSLLVDPLEALRDLSHAGAQLEEIVRGRVADARRQGATWEQIGESLAMSRQAACEYYTREVRRILEGTAAANDELTEDEALRMATEKVDELRRQRSRRSGT